MKASKSLSDAAFESMVAIARRTNKERDEAERVLGLATPSECGQRLWLATALSAIRCGIMTGDRGALLEGYAMLQDITEAAT